MDYKKILIELMTVLVGIILIAICRYHNEISNHNSAKVEADYTMAINEYNWSLFREEHGDKIQHHAVGLARIFPNVGDIGTFTSAVEEQLRQQYYATGSVDMDFFRDMLGPIMEKRYEPQKVCCICGFEVGPTVGDFVRSSGSPKYLKDGGISFPFELAVDGRIGYHGYVVLYVDRLEVKAANKDVINGRYCKGYSCMVYIPRRTEEGV